MLQSRVKAPPWLFIKLQKKKHNRKVLHSWIRAGANRDLTNEGHCHSGWPPPLPCSASTGFLPPFIIPGWPRLRLNPEDRRKEFRASVCLSPALRTGAAELLLWECVVCDLWPLAGRTSGRLSFPGLAWLERHSAIGQQTRAESK